MELLDRWDCFMESGRIEDYLDYCRARQNDNTREHSPYGTTTENKVEARYGGGADRSDRNGADGISGKGI